MNLAFVLDTSPSMAQRTPEGISFLDCCKAAVEVILKARLRSGSDFGSDKYLLLTTGKTAILSGWEHEPIHFFRTLKAVSKGNLDVGVSLAQAVTLAFSQLNAFRHMSNTDTYGFGRLTSRAESGAVVVLTDRTGASLRREQLRNDSITSPFTSDVWRYDQRLFIFQMHNPFSQVDVPESSPLPETTGGKTLILTSFAAALQAGEQLVTSYLNYHVFTVHLQDEERKVLPASFILDKKLRSNNWPLPEDYIQIANQLPPRCSNPICAYTSKNPFTKFQPPADFPCEAYDLLPSPQFEAEFLVKLKPHSGVVFIPLSIKDHPKPFGGLCVDSEGNVKMFVYCYNFMELWECLEFYKHQLAPKAEKSKHFEDRLNQFFRELPQYYHHLIPSALKSMKLYLPSTLKFPVPSPLPPDFVSQLKLLGKQETQIRRDTDILSKQLGEQHAMGTAVCCSQYTHSLYSDAFAIPRKEVKTALTAMCQQFFASEMRNEILISRMGDYHDALSKRGVLRDPYHEKEINLVLSADNFGNPFRKMSKGNSQSVPMNEPDIRVPFQREESAATESRVQLVKLPVKRFRGFSAAYERLKFVKRQSQSILKVISMLRDPSPFTDDQLMVLINNIISKVYKKKNSATIVDYKEGKQAFLEAMVTQARIYKKPELATKIENAKKGLSSQ